ncbi:MAG: DUF3014 domain-containing protein [Gallionella sp.]|nr:DUF3014 domain-containing protein [Gallionella sp.]
MNKKMSFAIAALILLGAAFAAYLFWQSEQPEPEIVQIRNIPPSPPPPPPPVPAPAPTVSREIKTPPAQPLVQLAKSDSFVFDALADLVGNPALMKFFRSEQIIRKIVVTVDNLPQQRVPVKVMPFKPPAGSFLTAGAEENLAISPKNSGRYASYVEIAEAIDTKKLVELYVRLYPLFQQVYGELGYPDKNFNDQLIETMDDLLDTPVVKEPIKLVQPKYFYQYADPGLEALSIGQKIMLRLGSKNGKRVKNKLLGIKQELELRANAIGGGSDRW